jgi:hypothetical protein
MCKPTHARAVRLYCFYCNLLVVDFSPLLKVASSVVYFWIRNARQKMQRGNFRLLSIAIGVISGSLFVCCLDGLAGKI